MSDISGYIAEQRASGHSDEAIKHALKSAGWDESQINQAMGALHASHGASADKFAFIRKYRLMIWIVVAVAVLSLGGYKAFSYFMNDPSKIWADTSQNMLDISSAKFKFEASYSERTTPETSDDSGFLGGFLGENGEVKFGISGDGLMVIKDTDADFDMNSKLSYQLGTLSISFGFASRKVGDWIYYKVDGNPLAGLFGSDSSGDKKAEWFKTSLKSEDNTLAVVDAQKTQIIDAFKKAKLMRPVKLLGSENIDGVATLHYQAELDKNELKNYFMQVAKITGDEDSEVALNSIMNKLEFKKLELWIGKADHLVHQAVIETNAPSLLQAVSGALQPTAGRDSFDPWEGVAFSGLMQFKMNLSDFNGNQKIEAPMDAVDMSMKSRDARRIADMHQIMTGLELFYNDNGRYPTATNGQVNLEDGSKDLKFSTYIAVFPTAPTPPDGSCTEAQNKYVYQQLKQGADYRLTFCLGGDTGSYKAGPMQASGSGMANQ